MAIRPTPPPADIADYLRYDPATGVFVWAKATTSSHTQYVGTVAGASLASGYVRLRFRGLRYLAHNVAWFIMTGDWPRDFEVDHRNGNTADNRWNNLRRATRTQQCANKAKCRGTSSRFKGVCWKSRDRTWVAQIQVARKVIYLGQYADEMEAARVYHAAAIAAYGDFAVTGFHSRGRA